MLPNVERPFAGAAEDYARYRVPYPAELISDLAGRIPAGRRNRLIDLACGPGRLTLPLAAHFHEVVAIDIEPDMIAEARRRSASGSLHNIDWRVAPAESLTFPSNSVDLVTVADAFHRLDPSQLPAQAKVALAPGGARDEQTLRRFGFAEVATSSFVVPHRWTLDSIAGFFRSTSFASRQRLAERHPAFERDLARELLAHDPSGVYTENLRFGYTLGRKP